MAEADPPVDSKISRIEDLKGLLGRNDKVSNQTLDKIHNYIEDKFGEFFTAKALFEAGRQTAADKIDILEKELCIAKEKLHEYSTKVETNKQHVTELEKIIKNARDDAERTMQSLRKNETELESVRHARDLAVNERNALVGSLERKDNELERLKADHKLICKNLQQETSAKCEALASKSELISAKMEAEDRERQAELARSLLERQLSVVSSDLCNTTDQLQSLRLQYSSRQLEIETTLGTNKEKMVQSEETIANLKEINDQLSTRVENLSKQILALREQDLKMCENFKEEVHAKEKLVDIYKSVNEDSEAKAKELTDAIAELQKLLSEATEKCGDLETAKKQMEEEHEEVLESKNKIIQSLKTELENANDIMKSSSNQNIDQYVSELAPSAVAASKLLKSGMTLTQIFSQLVQISDELAREKDANRELNNTIGNIVSEVEKKAPEFRQLTLERDQANEANTAMSVQIESLVAECNNLRDECSEANKIANHYSRENARFKLELADLGKQVCFLLKEVEQSRGGSVTSGDQDSPIVTSKSTNSLDLSSSNLISKTLVTFSNIQELQINNSKLLQLVRELTSKQEEAERNSDILNSGEMQNKLQNYMIRVNELTEAQERQTKMLNGLIRQRDMYKKLYHDTMKANGQESNALHASSESLNKSDSFSNKAVSPDNQIKSVELEKLQSEFLQKEKQFEELKEEYKTYKEDMVTNQRMLFEQIDNLRKEHSELSNANGKILSLQEYNNEKSKTLQANIVTYKKQVSTLEEKCKNLSTTIAHQEMLIKQQREEAMKAQTSLSRAEVALDNSRQECKLLKDAENRLKLERDFLTREHQSQSLILNNLEMIKASVERAETEAQVRLEARLDDALRECSALRLRFQELQDENAEVQKQLQAKYESAFSREEEEKKIAKCLRVELEALRVQLDEKNKRLDEVSSKFKNITSAVTSDGASETVKRVNQLEQQVAAKTSEIQSLNEQLSTAKEHIKQYCNISECAEKELKILHDKHCEYKERIEKQLSEIQKSESQLQEKCGELEAELSLQSNGQYNKEAELKTRLNETKTNLDKVLKELEEKSSELVVAHTEISKLAETAQLAEEKYAHEIVLHSNDIQTLSELKEKYSKLNSQIDELTSTKNQSIENLENNKKAWEERQKILVSEKETIESRLTDLMSQNSALHDQIEALSAQLSISRVSKHSDSFNDSTTDVNKSFNEEEFKSAEHLLRIIKHLRKERDVTMAKFDILQTENKRLQTQLEITSKHLDEVKLALSQERENSEVNTVVVAKQSEILRKVETLNALTDSNRLLRDERDSLAARVEELSIITKKLEDDLVPLQEKNVELTSKIESLQNESLSYTQEIARWRNRCKDLVERANKTSPEDWKRLQNERETLVKMLSAEQENLKKLNEDATSIRLQKTQIEEQLANTRKQNVALNDDNKKLTEELNVVKHDVFKITQELKDSQVTLTDMNEQKSKMTDTLASKESDLNETKKKEMQIRAIAKRYKAQFEELTKTVEENKRKAEGELAASDALEIELKAARETNDKLRQDLEKLRCDNQDKEEKAKNVLKQAKNKIVQLTEAKTQLANQYTDSQKKFEKYVQNREENDVRMSVLKSQYEGRLTRLEKERNDAIVERTKEVEGLQQKIALLQRQLASQPGSKPPATEKTTSDPPTANIKPMAGIAQPTTSRSRAGDPTLPLASVRPTAAVPPSSPATASASPVTPANTHTTEYMPASSSRPLQTVPADGATASSISQDGGAPQQVVALVMPRVEGATASAASTEATSGQQAPSSSAGPGSGTPAATALRVKRPRPPVPGMQTQSTPKRSRLGFERSVEVEYQVPTSSRCDQEDDGVIVVDSEDEDNRCSGTAYQAEEAEENEEGSEQEDEAEGEEMEGEESEGNDDEGGEEDDEADAEMGSGGDVGNGCGDMDVGEAGEVVEGGDSSNAVAGSSEPDASQELPAQSSVEESAPDAATIASVISGDATPVTLRRPVAEAPPVASATGYDDHDDGIVPSTPTLYVPRRNDGFGEAVSSPGANAASSANIPARSFTFATPALDDTHADLAAQLPVHGDVPSIVVSQAEETEQEAAVDTAREEPGATTGDDDASAVSSQGSHPTSPPQGGSVEEGREAEASGDTYTPESVSTHGGAQRRGVKGMRRPYRAAHHHRPSPISWPHQDGGQFGRDSGGRAGQRPRRPYQRF